MARPAPQFKAAFDPSAAMISLKRNSKYSAAVNLAWVNPYYSTGTNVPIMWSSVEDNSA